LDDNGRRRYTNLGPDRGDAQRRYRLMQDADTPAGTFRAARAIYLRDEATRLRPQSIKRYESLTAHAERWFGDAALTAITGADVVKMRDALLEAGLATSHVRTIGNLTVAILKAAQERGLLERVPDVPKMKMGRDEGTQGVKVLELAVAEKIIARMPEPERTMSTLMLWTGMRPSELVALDPKHVSEGAIEVEKTAVQSTGGENAPKTRRGRRLIDLNRDAREAAAALTFPVDSTYKRWSERWRGAQAKAEVPYVPLKTLRHTNASLRLAAGQSVPYVAQQLGHSPEVLLSTYAHVIRALGVGQADLLDNVRQHGAP